MTGWHGEKEVSIIAVPQAKTYTLKDIYALEGGQRAELIDGQLYMMSPPRTIHQRLILKLCQAIANYIDQKGGNCEVFPAPFAVFLNEDDKNYVEPDISVICKAEKIDGRGCHGAPDWVIEIVSPFTQQMDYGIKLFKYQTAGVREYWIVNPTTRIVNVFDFENGKDTKQYAFPDTIPSCIYPGLRIAIGDLLPKTPD